MLLAVATALTLPVAAQTAFDPTLPASVRAEVEAAVEAELDPKRGPANGLAALEASMSAQQDPRLQQALRLRFAAMKLRQVFLEKSEFPPSKRVQQALTTFSRLELAEPGLAEWLARTVAAHPESKGALTTPLTVSVLASGAIRDRKALERSLVEKLEASGVEARVAPPEEATYRVSFGAENAQAPRPDAAAVRGNIEIRRLGEDAWKREISYTAMAARPELALAASLDALIRVGGRDMLFHWLGGFELPMMRKGPMFFSQPGMPVDDGHDGHGHH